MLVLCNVYAHFFQRFFNYIKYDSCLGFSMTISTGKIQWNLPRIKQYALGFIQAPQVFRQKQFCIWTPDLQSNGRKASRDINYRPDYYLYRYIDAQKDAQPQDDHDQLARDKWMSRGLDISIFIYQHVLKIIYSVPNTYIFYIMYRYIAK